MALAEIVTDASLAVAGAFSRVDVFLIKSRSRFELLERKKENRINKHFSFSLSGSYLVFKALISHN